MRSFLRRIVCIVMTAVIAAAFCTVTVSAASAKLSKTSLKLPEGYTYTLSVSGTKNKIKWSSSDSSVVAIKAKNGSSAKIIGKKTGTAYIYAKVDGVDLKCKVTVKRSVITASESSPELKTGESRKITLTVKGDKNIKVSSSDSNVCSASLGKWNGNKITLTVAAKKSGTAKIKIYPKGYTSSSKTITVKVTAETPKDANVKDKVSKDSLSTEDVIALINEERKAAGLPPLKSDPKLNQASAIRAQELAQYFSHIRPDGSDCFTVLSSVGFGDCAAGENIAAGQTSAKEVVHDWMSSTGHRDNILSSDFSMIGVGLYQGGKYEYYWVQMFAG